MTHRINHAELEVIVGDRVVGEQLLDRLSLLRERRIAPLIDRVCDELSGPERFDRIERIELDLGSIALADFDDDFIRKLEAALRRALAKAVPARADAQAQIQAALELVEIFAWTGNLPWWADANCSDPVRAQIEVLLGDAPRALFELLGELAKDDVALARVLRHVDARALAGLLRGEVDESIATRLGEALERPLAGEPDAIEQVDSERASLEQHPADKRSETFELLRELTRAQGLERAEAECDASVSVAVDDEQSVLRERAEQPRLAERLRALLWELIATGRAALETGRSSEESRPLVKIREAEPDRHAEPVVELASLEQHPADERSETFEALLREVADDRRLRAWVVRELERTSTEHDAHGPEPSAWSEAPRETARTRVLLSELAEHPPLGEHHHALLQALVAAGRAALERGRVNEEPHSSMKVGPEHEPDPHELAQRGAHASPEEHVARERSEPFEALLRELADDRRLRAWIVRELERASTEHDADGPEPSAWSDEPRETPRTRALLSELSELAEHPPLGEHLHALLQALVAASRAALEAGPSSEQEHPARERSETVEALLRELADDRRLHAWVIGELERASLELDGEKPEPSTSTERSTATTSLHALLLNQIAIGRADAATLADNPAQPRPLGRGQRQHAPTEHARSEPAANGPARARSPSEARTNDRRAPARAARRRAVERLEEIYVDDAGIVLLWPFLGRFFARVGLHDDKQRFLDEPARMQAVALLELIAREDLDPPEFRLPLAKLLCGLAPIDEFELEHPLAPEQVEECEHLLTAVIDNAPILRAMSVPSFRASFLQRPAVLSTRDGTWLLQVERADYDVVLERFPWSWDWLKLPWMPEALRVEW